MTVDLDKNKIHVLQVYDDVLNDKSSTDWALFGYEGQTNVLKVVGFGDDGIEELVDELNASKIMYGIVRVIDPKTSRTKVILLNWQGESAPHLRKGICARHLPEVKKLFKGVHITITARTEEDVDSDMILAAVAKATSTEYNFKERSEHPDKSVPVGTNYKRTNPQTEIDANRRNKFWEEQEAEEKIRKEQEIRRKEDEAKRLEKERVQRELRDSKHREELNKERNARIVAEKKAEMVAVESGRKKDALSWEKEVKSQQTEEEERTRRADQMRMERKKEAESLIGHKTHQTRSIFESSTITSTSQIQSSQGPLSKPPPRKLKDFAPAKVENVEERISYQKENLAPKKSVGARWPPQPEEPSPQHSPVSVPGKIADWKPKEEINASLHTSNKNNSQQSPAEVGRSSEKSEASRVSSTAESASINNVQTSLAHQYSYKTASETSSIQHSSIPSQPQQTTVAVTTPVSSLTANVSTAPPQISENGGGAEHVLPQLTPNEYNVKTSNHFVTNGGLEQSADIGSVSPYEVEGIDDLGSVCMTYEVDGVEYQILPEHGLCARALYDYQAADDTEITFDPGDIITNIDQIDVGWWQGVSALGLFGLFPANYVELINGTKIH